MKKMMKEKKVVNINSDKVNDKYYVCIHSNTGKNMAINSFATKENAEKFVSLCKKNYEHLPMSRGGIVNENPDYSRYVYVSDRDYEYVVDKKLFIVAKEDILNYKKEDLWDANLILSA